MPTFVFNFRSEHLLIDGVTWINQYQRRWLEGANAAEVRHQLEKHLADPYYWPPQFHRAQITGYQELSSEEAANLPSHLRSNDL